MSEEGDCKPEEKLKNDAKILKHGVRGVGVERRKDIFEVEKKNHNVHIE